MDGDAPGIWSELAIFDVLTGDVAAGSRDIERAKRKNPSDLRAWEAEALAAARAANWPLAVEKLNFHQAMEQLAAEAGLGVPDCA